MTKSESRLLREVRNHCKYSELGYLRITDKKRFYLIDKMIGKQLIDIVSFSDNQRTITI